MKFIPGLPQRLPIGGNSFHCPVFNLIIYRHFTDTLLSKILLGTMACVPAYDRYFIAGLKMQDLNNYAFDKPSLNELFHFIEANKQQIGNCQRKINEKIGSHYPAMKLVDMYFWQIGFDNSAKKNRQ